MTPPSRPSFLYLPLANEVWSRVIFSQACASRSVQRGVSLWCHCLSGCLMPCSFWEGLCVWSHVPSGGLGVSVQGVCVHGGLCPWGSLSGGSLSRWSLSRGVSVWGGASVWEISVWGVSVPAGSLSKGLPDRDPPPPDRNPSVRWRAGSTHPAGMKILECFLCWCPLLCVGSFLCLANPGSATANPTLVNYKQISDRNGWTNSFQNKTKQNRNSNQPPYFAPISPSISFNRQEVLKGQKSIRNIGGW